MNVVKHASIRAGLDAVMHVQLIAETYVLAVTAYAIADVKLNAKIVLGCHVSMLELKQLLSLLQVMHQDVQMDVAL